MANRTLINSHSFHPACKTVGEVCFICASELLSKANRTPIWQLSLLLENLHNALWDHSDDFKEMASGETKTWLTHFTQLLLGNYLCT